MTFDIARGIKTAFVSQQLWINQTIGSKWKMKTVGLKKLAG